MHNKATAGQESTPYKFTSKELDEETGLYYYGHRYLDPRLSSWISVDPLLITGEYLPTGNKEKNKNLPGMGGVFNSINLDAYHYAGNNPIKYLDPDGKESYLASRDLDTNKTAGLGLHSFIAIVTDNPSKYGNHADKFIKHQNTTGNFPNVGKGKDFYIATLSGIAGGNGKLIKDVKNEGDNKSIIEMTKGTNYLSSDLDLNLHKLTSEGGQSEFQMEKKMLNIFDSYDNNVDYSAGAFGDKRNCHSLSGTVAKKAGANNIPYLLPGVSPGKGSSIPDKNFKSETSGPKKK